METIDSATGFETHLVWQKSHQFVLQIYKMTNNYPVSEKFGLTSQLGFAAVSLPANVAEGYGKRSSADKVRFYNISRGSINEFRYYLRLTTDLSYAETETMTDQLNKIGRMLNSYTKKILPA